LTLPVESNDETWWIERLLLVAVLTMIPLAHSIIEPPDRHKTLPLPSRVATLIQPIAALLAVISFYTRTGPAAALLTLGWLLLTGLMAMFGLTRLRRRGLWPLEELCIDAGLGYLLVGGIWLFASRLGVNLLGFSDTIVLLTAVHFHYAGFAAPILAGLAGRKISKVNPRARSFYLPACAGVMAGPPLVAAGITFSRAVEVFSASLLALSILVLAMLILLVIVPALNNRFAQILLIISAVAVIVTMAFACLYAIGRFKGIETVSILRMAQIHGLSNALGFVLCGLLAWIINQRASD
jgi:hypothetical protein